jgi:hypothetical protein
VCLELDLCECSDVGAEEQLQQGEVAQAGVSVYTPAGVRIDAAGFATCTPSVLEAQGPAACPKRSSAGPVGVGLGVVTFGGERVPEQVSIRDFFTSFDVKVGATFRRGGKFDSYITEPRKCPPTGFPVKIELKFLNGETTTLTETLPCPAR